MWIYQQDTGRLYYTKQEYSEYTAAPTPLAELELIGTGYSGRDRISHNSHIHGRNNSEAESIKNFGPIPRGLWYIGPGKDDPKMGPLAIKLIADKQTNTFNRSDFFIHGDNWKHCASEGCIIQDHPTREKVDTSIDKILLVIA